MRGRPLQLICFKCGKPIRGRAFTQQGKGRLWTWCVPCEYKRVMETVRSRKGEDIVEAWHKEHKGG